MDQSHEVQIQNQSWIQALLKSEDAWMEFWFDPAMEKGSSSEVQSWIHILIIVAVLIPGFDVGSIFDN